MKRGVIVVLHLGLLLAGCSAHTSPEVLASKVKSMTAKQFCRSEGGSWSWSRAKDKWICSGVDMSSYYKIIDEKYARKRLLEKQKRLREKIEREKAKQREKERVARLERIKHTKLIGSENFKNVKFINGVLWEDQPFNAIPDNVNFKECKKHCQNLNLLGISEWEVPSRDQYEVLGKGYSEFDHKVVTLDKGFIRYRSPYIAKGECDRLSRDSDTCVYRYDLQEQELDISSAGSSYACRCALDADTYNSYVTNQLNQLEEKTLVKDFNYYIKRFDLTDDVSYLKKAETLAKSRKEKAQVENGYVKYVGDYWKIFKIYSKNQTSSKNASTNDRFLFIGGISDVRKTKYKVTLKQNPKSPVPLKYGDYTITIEAVLRLTYSDTSGIGILRVNTQNEQSIRRTLTFHLNRQNGYKDIKQIDFGSVIMGQKGDAFVVVKIDSKLENAQVEYRIQEIK